VTKMDNSFILLWKLIKVWTHGVDNGGVQGEGHTIGATEYIHCRVGTQPHVYKKNVSHARGGGWKNNSIIGKNHLFRTI